MDEYPAHSLDHNIPLLVLLGLSLHHTQQNDTDSSLRDGATLLRSNLPPVSEDQIGPFLQYIQGSDASDLPWSGRDNSGKYKFRVKTAGREYSLPPRRAELPENFEVPESPVVLHSPFSPLSPASPLYPDGLIDTRWLKKHQDLIPSVFVSLYSLTSDPTLATLDDNKIKSDISDLKNSILQSGFKSRLAVVILPDQSSRTGEGVQDRLENIRKGSGLDAKSFFSLPAHGSREDIERIADNTLITLYAHALEYYRDLGRHARKKRSRGIVPQPTVPPTSGTSQTLSLLDWNIRYDFKSAIFAEYRQEMDASARSFEQAYDTLLSAEVLDIIPSWSPRWNEARLLADIIAVRVMRCLLWNGQHTAAVRRWQQHRHRIADFVDRRGHGTSNYGWEAWEARWAIIMANLVEKADIEELAAGTLSLYLPPEKVLVAERLQPWEFLHHTGYWYRIASHHMKLRRALAHAMPEDDRRPPSMSPARQVASKAFTYDTYMCPEPYEEYPLDHVGVDHSQMIIDCLTAARSQFASRRQLRLAAETALECAKELAGREAWQDVIELLRPLWDDMSFRVEGWLDIAEELSWTLRAAAQHTSQPEIILSIDWELLNKAFTRRPKWHYDISRSLANVEAQKPTVKIVDDLDTSFLSAAWIFRNEEGKAGHTCQSQLSVTSNAFPDSVPIVFNSIVIDFEGCLRRVVLTNAPTENEADVRRDVIVASVALEERVPDDNDRAKDVESTPILQGTSNLTLAPGKTLVFGMDIPLREPGDANAAFVKFSLDNDAFSLEHTTILSDSSGLNTWFLSPTSRRQIARANPHTIRILPRPPKMTIEALNVRDQYYTNEPIEIHLKLINQEDVDAIARLDVTLFGEQPPNFRLKAGQRDESRALADDEESKLSAISLDTIRSSEATPIIINITPTERTAAFSLALKVSYHLITDPATPIIQTAEFQLSVASPFEANYDLLPRLHPGMWPSLFDYEGVLDFTTDTFEVQQPRGLSQSWCLVTRYASFAAEDLKVMDVDIDISPAHGVRCQTSKVRDFPEKGLMVSPKTIEEAQFTVDAQKLSVDDRTSASLDVSFIIKWARIGKDGATVNRTVLPVPRLNIFGMEPRVLASISYSTKPTSLVLLHITLENPSNHFLTFGLTMDPSEEFAFSGAKTTTLHLLPVSRRSVTYRLLPFSSDTWIKPTLVVRDKYFQKVLRIIPTEGMKLDKDGFLIWVPPAGSTRPEDGPPPKGD